MTHFLVGRVFIVQKRLRRAAIQVSNKRKRTPKRKTFKHGLEVPRTWNDIVRIDTEAKNRLWQKTVEEDDMALIEHGCFDFKTPNYKPPSVDYILFIILYLT